MLKGRKVLITGAGGFIGSHLCERIVHEGAVVTALVRYNSRSDWGLLELVPRHIRDEVRIIHGDVRDAASVLRAMHAQEIVFHLAALIGIPYSYEAPESYVATNVGGTLNVLEAARRSNLMRVVHTSTSEVYGSALYTPIDEKHPLQGQSPYSATKIGADMLAESYARSFGTPVVTLRPFNTFGPRQSARAVIPTIVSQALKGGSIQIGSINTLRDFTFVADTVDAFVRLAIADVPPGIVLNSGTGQATSIAEVIRRVGMLLGCELAVVQSDQRMRPARSEVDQLIACPGMAESLIGWQAATNLDDGLKIVIDFIAGHPEMYKADRYNV
jgi:NAD dependent epimerase/dehydratase